MRIAIVGTGGVGGFFGGRLARAGNDVHFIARGSHLAAIREHGLQVESIEGDFVVSPANVTDDPATVGTVDATIFGVKSWQLREAGEAARPLFGPESVALPLLNGVEAPAILSEILGSQRVLGGLCRIGAEIAAPGRIRHSAMRPTIALGELDGVRSPRVDRLASTLADAGIVADVPADIQVAMWEKFLLIATWSGIGAVTRAPIGLWREVPGIRALAEAALEEVVAVGRARGVRLGNGTVEATLGVFDAIDPSTTASMQRDVMGGRPSELEAQNGAVVRMGVGAEVATPVHSLIYDLLLPQERIARGSA